MAMTIHSSGLGLINGHEWVLERRLIIALAGMLWNGRALHIERVFLVTVAVGHGNVSDSVEIEFS